MKTDVAIVGAGPGGTSTALFLAQRGIESVIVERESFPRYQIGESLTGECGLCLKNLGLEPLMSKRAHPIKHGVRVYGPGGKNSFYVPVMARTEDGELRHATTWQVRRSDFDNMVLDAAKERGVKVIRGKAIDALRDAAGGVSGVRVRAADGEELDIESKVLVDASGRSTFLSNIKVAGKKTRGDYDRQIAVFSQVRGAVRGDGEKRDDTLIFIGGEKNHWAWFIPLDDQVVSVGVTVPAEYFSSMQESKQDFLLRELHELNPELKRRLPEMELAESVRTITNYSYRVSDFTGRGFLCVGDAHRFIDPIFSFGVYFSIKEAQFAAQAIESHLGGAGNGDETPFADYELRCDKGQDVIQDLIDGFWNHPYAFALFVHSRYVDDFVDLFAGRVYGDEMSPGYLALKKVNQRGADKAFRALG